VSRGHLGMEPSMLSYGAKDSAGYVL
jgi:hypothetical protein